MRGAPGEQASGLCCRSAGQPRSEGQTLILPGILIRRRPVITELSGEKAQRSSAALGRQIRHHRRAYLAYERVAPLADPLDRRYSAKNVAALDLWQGREARRRLNLLAHPVRSLADMRAKAEYLLAYSDSDFLISGEADVAIFLKAMVPANGDVKGAIDDKQELPRRRVAPARA